MRAGGKVDAREAEAEGREGRWLRASRLRGLRSGRGAHVEDGVRRGWVEEGDGHHRLDRLPREHAERAVVRQPFLHRAERRLARCLQVVLRQAVELPAATPAELARGRERVSAAQESFPARDALGYELLVHCRRAQPERRWERTVHRRDERGPLGGRNDALRAVVGLEAIRRYEVRQQPWHRLVVLILAAAAAVAVAWTSASRHRVPRVRPTGSGRGPDHEVPAEFHQSHRETW